MRVLCRKRPRLSSTKVVLRPSTECKLETGGGSIPGPEHPRPKLGGDLHIINKQDEKVLCATAIRKGR